MLDLGSLVFMRANAGLCADRRRGFLVAPRVGRVVPARVPAPKRMETDLGRHAQCTSVQSGQVSKLNPSTNDLEGSTMVRAANGRNARRVPRVETTLNAFIRVPLKR